MQDITPDQIEFTKPQLIIQQQFFDHRGKFLPTPTDSRWIQDNVSTSKKGTFRGMHFQVGNYSQAKLVRVLSGSVIDIIVDLRNHTDNKNYLNVYYYYLAGFDNAHNHYSLYIPRGFAHGFIALEDNTVFNYLVDNLYDPESDRTINYKSFPFIVETANRFGFSETELLISPKDHNAPMLEDWLEKKEIDTFEF